MNKQPDLSISHALRTYPSEAAPPAMVAKTMERVESTDQLRFRLGWFDIAVSTWTTGTAGLCFYLWRQLAVHSLAGLQLDLLQIGHALRVLWFVSLLGLGHH